MDFLPLQNKALSGEISNKQIKVYAKNKNGLFKLRIEDTDKLRSEQQYVNEICDSLRWLGLNWDQDLVYQSKR